jgi:hypothetical protein
MFDFDEMKHLTKDSALSLQLDFYGRLTPCATGNIFY